MLGGAGGGGFTAAALAAGAAAADRGTARAAVAAAAGDGVAAYEGLLLSPSCLDVYLCLGVSVLSPFVSPMFAAAV